MHRMLLRCMYVLESLIDYLDLTDDELPGPYEYVYRRMVGKQGSSIL